MKFKKLKFIFFVFFSLCILSANKTTSFAQTIEGLETECKVCAQFVPECGPNEVLVPQSCEKCAHCKRATDTPSETITENPKPGEVCQKCTIHAQCPNKHICINDCCRLKPGADKPKRVFKDLTKATPLPKPTSTSKIKQKFLRESKAPSCIVCPQFVPECGPNEILIPQTCKQCAHCERIKPLVKDDIKQKKVKDKKKDPGKTECKKQCGLKCCKENEKCITIDQCKGRKKLCKLPTLQYCSTKSPEPLRGRLHSF